MKLIMMKVDMEKSKLGQGVHLSEVAKYKFHWACPSLFFLTFN